MRRSDACAASSAGCMADQSGELRHRDQAAEQYEDWYKARGALFDWVEKRTVTRLLRLEPGQSLWDAGCGTGRFSRPAAAVASRVYATDFSPRSIELLKETCREQGITNVEATVADLTDPPPFEEKVDRVLSVQTVQHLPTAGSRLDAVRHMYGQLVDGGRAVVVVYNWSAQQRQGLEKQGTIKDGFHYYRFTPAETVRLMHDAGFDAVMLRGSNHFMRMHGLRSTPVYPLLKPLAWLDVMLSGAPGSPRRGNFLVAVGRKGASST